MANFNTLAEVQTSTSGDFYHLQQGGIDYKHTRETLAGAIANARWSNTFTYTSGSEVVGSDNEKYVAVATSTGEDPTTDDGTYWRVLSRDEVAPNKVKTSQFVVEGTTGDPLPTASATSYLSGSEMAFGWVVTTDVVDAVIDANGNLTATSGVVEYTFNKADNETPNAANLFASVMRCTDAANSVYVQDYADGGNGISLVNETATTITLRIDFSSFAGGKVFGTSEQFGRLPIESTSELGPVDYIDPDAVGANPTAMIYPDGTIVGSTDNGEYIKHQNGTLEVRRLIGTVISSGAGIAPDALYLSSDYTYPHAFISDPEGFTFSGKGMTSFDEETGPVGFRTHNTTEISFFIRNNSANFIDKIIECGYTCTGRWK